ncbi:MAG: hypothetical protein AAFP97_11465 [Pseudomonadota bacterium]
MLKKIAIGFGVLVGLYGLVQLMPSTQNKNEAESWADIANHIVSRGERVRGGLLFEIMPQDVRYAFQSISVANHAQRGGRKTALRKNKSYHTAIICEGSFCKELRIPADRYSEIKTILSDQQNWNWIEAATTCVRETAWCGVKDWNQLERQYGIDGRQALRDYMAGWNGKPCSEVQHCRELTAILGPIA